MAIPSNERIRKVTTELNDEILRDFLTASEEPIYHQLPYVDNAGRPVWRMRLDLAYDSMVSVGLDVNGELVLGRGNGKSDETILPVSNKEADQLGISRRHAMLRPTENKLYIIDLESTNGTIINGRSIGSNAPFSLSNGDHLMLGRLELIVRILKRPKGQTALLQSTDIADLMPPIVRSIVSQLEVDQALKKALEMTKLHTSTDEVAIWLVDEQNGELFLEAGLSINDDDQLTLPISDVLAARVAETEQPMRAGRQKDRDDIKLKTGFLVEAAVYLPLKVGGIMVGVLSAAHQEAGRDFSKREEKILTAIAEFTAVAVQNARLYQATLNDLTRHTKVVTALNYALAYDFKNLVNSTIGYAGLLGIQPLDDEAAEIANEITLVGHNMASLVEQLIQVAALSENPNMHFKPCDLIEIVNKVLEDLQLKADAKSTELVCQISGEPYIIQGDIKHLHRSVFNLVDNGIKFSPPESQVSVMLIFGNDVIIRVRDTGPGIPEEDLPYLFDKYFRGKRADGQSGIGLGLEFARATAEAHRGTLVARNAQDGGAELILTLPGKLRVH